MRQQQAATSSDKQQSDNRRKRLAKASEQVKMSNPRWMMEAEFEAEGYEYEDYDNDEGFAEENEEYYTTYGDGVCTICMGGSFVRKIYIEEEDWEEQEDYDF